MDAQGIAALAPQPAAQAAFNERVQQRLARTVWNTGGCASWYLDAHGRNTTLWPTFTFTFRQELRRFDLAGYETAPRRPVAEPVAS